MRRRRRRAHTRQTRVSSSFVTLSGGWRFETTTFIRSESTSCAFPSSVPRRYVVYPEMSVRTREPVSAAASAGRADTTSLIRRRIYFGSRRE